MKKSRYTEEHVVGSVKRIEGSRRVKELARELEVSEAPQERRAESGVERCTAPDFFNDCLNYRREAASRTSWACWACHGLWKWSRSTSPCSL